ncbi:MAG: hypothetical protein ABIS92_05135 [Polyangia bacterium]
MADPGTRFPIAFDTLYRVLSSALLLLPSASYVEVRGDDVHVRMGWAFRTCFPRKTIRSIGAHAGRPLSRGVHGFAGRWIVNGSGERILAIGLEPPQRAYVLGFPVRLALLLVSVEDPTALARELGD